MAVKISGEYIDNKKIRLIHEPSGQKLETAPPKDNCGDGSSFSPTDLVASALVACMTTIISIVAERDQIDISKMRMLVEKHMNTDPRRIGSLPVTIWLPEFLTEKERRKLETAAKTCQSTNLYIQISKWISSLFMSKAHNRIRILDEWTCNMHIASLQS